MSHPKYLFVIIGCLIIFSLVFTACHDDSKTLEDIETIELDNIENPRDLKTVSGVFDPSLDSSRVSCHYSVSTTEPGEQVGATVQLEDDDHDQDQDQDIELPAKLFYYIIELDEEKEAKRIVEYQEWEATQQDDVEPSLKEESPLHFRENLPEKAPAKYLIYLDAQNSAGEQIGKIISPLSVPPQELNARLELSNDSIKEGQDVEMELTLINEGPTDLFFGLPYQVEKHTGGEWENVENVPLRGWVLVGHSLEPESSFEQELENADFSFLDPGKYRVSKEVEAEGTDISRRLEAIFIVQTRLFYKELLHSDLDS